MQVAPNGSILKVLSDLVQTPVEPGRHPNAATRAAGVRAAAPHAEAGHRPRSHTPPAPADGARGERETVVSQDLNAPRGTYLDIFV